MTTQENPSGIVLELDKTNQSTTYHKIGTIAALEPYAKVRQSLALPDQTFLLVDLSADVYGLSLTEQQQVKDFIVAYSLNPTTHAFAQSIDQDDSAGALTALKTMMSIGSTR